MQNKTEISFLNEFSSFAMVYLRFVVSSYVYAILNAI